MLRSKFARLWAWSVLAMLAFQNVVDAEDTVVFLNGNEVTGTITSIRKADKEFDFETTIGGQHFTKVYDFSDVHAVVYNGSRYELTPKPTAAGAKSDRSRKEVLALIDAAGRTPPDWYDATPLDYPKTLDLSWPLKPPTEGWQQNKNMGQYIWSVINENPGRWRSGIKLIHHVMTLHSDNPMLLNRDMDALGAAYFRLMQDYPRAAFWFQQAKVDVASVNGVRLAECYWRLGNREMALEMLRDSRLHISAIKLLGDMGEIDRALALARSAARFNAGEANILAADALRLAGRFDQAIRYYQKVLDAKNYRNKDYENRYKSRARESIETIRLYDQADVTQVADGTYKESSTGYNGKLTVEVKVAAGKLVGVNVIDHKEKQFYSALTDTPDQLMERQSVVGVDATSGATITSQAIINATAKALAKGSR